MNIYTTVRTKLNKIKIMKKYIFTILLSIITISTLTAQQTVSGQSESTNLEIIPVYERDMPPNLFMELDFSDDNNNGILEAGEKAEIQLSITNQGKGPAQGITVKVKDSIYDPNLKILGEKKIPFIYPNQTVTFIIPLYAKMGITQKEHKLEIIVAEYFGYDMESAYVVLNTMKYLKPELVLSGIEVIDSGKGTGAIIEDGQLQAGELVKVKITVQNIGQNVSKNTGYKVYAKDKNIYLEDNNGNLGDIEVNEVKDFFITVSPNKRVKTKNILPIFLETTNDYHVGNINSINIPVKLNHIPPQVVLKNVEADYDNLIKPVARMETSSQKIKSNFGNYINIRQMGESKTVRNNSVAIIMGIENYKQNDIPNAPYAKNDADIMEEYFKNVLGIKYVYKYTDKDIQGYFFRNTFGQKGELQKAIIKDKTDLFVYYSGHGFPSKDGENVYILASDGNKYDLERQGYNLNDFYKDIASLGAKSTTIFMDACFSGSTRSSELIAAENLTGMKGVRIKPQINSPWETNSDFTLCSSSSYDETSMIFDDSKTGLFTYFLCAGLKGEADKNNDGKITMGELKKYIQKNVLETSQKLQGTQTPLFYGTNEETELVNYK